MFDDNYKSLDDNISSSIDESVSAEDVLSKTETKENTFTIDDLLKDGKLSKTLGITGLQGNERREFIGTETNVVSAEGMLEASSCEVRTKEKEPPYYKVYMDAAARFGKIPQGQRNLVGQLAHHMDYQGVVHVNSYLREKICKELDIKPSSFKNYLSKAKESGVITAVGRGSYQLHPAIYGRGSWADVKKQRHDHYNKAVALLTIDIDEASGEVLEQFKFFDREQAREILRLFGADEDALQRFYNYKSKK